MSIFQRIKDAYAIVSPKALAERQLRAAQFDLLVTLQAEEDALASAGRHAADAEVLAERIARLQEYLGSDEQPASVH